MSLALTDFFSVPNVTFFATDTYRRLYEVKNGAVLADEERLNFKELGIENFCVLFEHNVRFQPFVKFSEDEHEAVLSCMHFRIGFSDYYIHTNKKSLLGDRWLKNDIVADQYEALYDFHVKRIRKNKVIHGHVCLAKDKFFWMTNYDIEEYQKLNDAFELTKDPHSAIMYYYEHYIENQSA